VKVNRVINWKQTADWLVFAFFAGLFLHLICLAGVRDEIFFRHQRHDVELKQNCLDCHDVMLDDLDRHAVIPDHENCVACHDVDDKNECILCHTDTENALPIPLPERNYPSFTHSAHQQFPCTRCHVRLFPDGMEIAFPEPEDCRRCHDESKPRPTDHLWESWLLQHGIEASLNETSCSVCHTQESCDNCHQGTGIYGATHSPHPPTWLFNHFADAAFGGECLVCHESRKFCVDCHRRMIHIPHPFGWGEYANREDGGKHVEEARLYLETCLSCHDVEGEDHTCGKCH